MAHTLHPITEPFEGGLEMITYLLCSSLMDRGHDIDLYAHKDSSSRFNLLPFDYERKKVKVPAKYLNLDSTIDIDGAKDTSAYSNA
ncbi:MAG: hypothetical protein WBB27_03250, partial [Maribacter sp.]